MLSLSNISAHQAENYYEKDDYYSHDLSSESQVRWLGKGTASLGLSDTFQSEEFKALLYGQDLQGNALHAKRIDPTNHRAATDYTFSAPKSVSIAALIQQDNRVVEAHDRAVKVALEVMEVRYTQTRITTEQGRQKIKTGNLVAAVFRHETSREQDPQLHSHCVVINATKLPDGSWRSMSNEAAIAHQKLLGQIYQNELAFRLQQCGYEIEIRPHGQFELKGYGQKILDIYSTRTQAIQAHLERWEQTQGEIATPAQRKAATLKTRKNKVKDVDREALLQQWASELKVNNLRLPDIPENQSVLIAGEHNAILAVNTGVNHCSERESLFRRAQVERFALEHHLGEQSFSNLQMAFNCNAELILAELEPERYTTVAAIDRELSTIQMMRNGQGRFEAIASLDQLNQFVQHLTLTDEQRDALALSMTTQDQFLAWQGVAGAGKTYALYCLSQFAIAQGYQVRGFAPSAEAANELAREAEISSRTVTSLLNHPPTSSLLEKEIWIVDEAGLLGAKDAHELLKRATQQQARVILVGDTRQLSAVQAGNPFRALQNAGIEIAYLNRSLRQKTPKLKSAIAQIAQGEIEQGIEALIQAGRIREIQDPAEQRGQLVHDYINLLPDERNNTLVVTATNNDLKALTQQIRGELKTVGQLSEDIYSLKGLRTKNLTIAQAKYTKYYAAGDVLVFHQNYKKQGLEKNQPYQIVAIQSHTLILRSPSGQWCQIEPSQCEKKTVYQAQVVAISNGDRLRWIKNDAKANTRNGQAFTVNTINAQGNAQIIYDDGKATQIQFKDQQYLDYAWVNTVYGSQGKTCDRVLAAIDGMVNRESFYVTVSRARHELTVYTTNQVELMRRAKVSRAKETALILYQETYNAKSSQISTHNSNDSIHNRDAGSRLGASLAATLRADSQLGDGVNRLIHSTGRNARVFESLPRTVAEFTHCRRHQLEIERLGKLFETINFYFEYPAMQTAELLESELQPSPVHQETRIRERIPQLFQSIVSGRQSSILKDQEALTELQSKAISHPQAQEIAKKRKRSKDNGLEL